jgi:hypothetical protein
MKSTKPVPTINTSLNQIPALFNKFKFPKDVTIINYGCGRYPDNVSNGFKNTVISYDPQFDNHKNQKTEVIEDITELFYVVEEIESKKVVFCANVLNVLNDEELDDCIRDLGILHNLGCEIIIGIYEGNRSSSHKQTTKGFQRNEPTKEYLNNMDFDNITVKGKFIIIE